MRQYRAVPVTEISWLITRSCQPVMGLKTVKQTGNVILVCRNEHCQPMKTERHEPF